MIVQYVKLTIIGLVSGLLAGVVGGGSDAVIVPALVGMGVLGSYKTAVGTSLATLLPPVGIFAVWNYYKKGDEDEILMFHENMFYNCSIRGLWNYAYYDTVKSDYSSNLLFLKDMELYKIIFRN